MYDLDTLKAMNRRATLGPCATEADGVLYDMQVAYDKQQSDIAYDLRHAGKRNWQDLYPDLANAPDTAYHHPEVAELVELRDGDDWGPASPWPRQDVPESPATPEPVLSEGRHNQGWPGTPSASIPGVATARGGDASDRVSDGASLSERLEANALRHPDIGQLVRKINEPDPAATLVKHQRNVLVKAVEVLLFTAKSGPITDAVMRLLLEIQDQRAQFEGTGGDEA